MSAENKWQPRDAELTSPPLYIIEGYSHFLEYPIYIELIHSTGGEIDQLLGFRSDGHVLHTELLRLNAPSTTTQRAATDSL
jgi:hypothetical protein